MKWHMRVNTVVQVGGVLTAAGLLLSPTTAWAHHEDGWAPEPQPSEQPQDYPQQPEPSASAAPASPAPDEAGAESDPATATTVPPARSSSTVGSTDTAATQATAATCPTDDGLPVPVAGTVVDTLETVEGTVEDVAGPLPVDLAGTVGGALGCTPEPETAASPAPAPSDGAAATASDEPTAQEESAVAAMGAVLPEAESAQAVSARVAFAG